MRVPVEFRTASKENHKAFCKKFPDIKLSYTEWANIIYLYNESYKEYLLETGNKERLPLGLGDFAIIKKKRKRMTGENDQYINLPIDWQKTKEKGKRIYNFNYHTEGFFFGWYWFKESARFRFSNLWYFKPTRVTSRLLNHYIKVDDKYQHLYHTWKV